MNKGNYKNLVYFVKTEKRFFGAVIFFAVAFLINQALYANHRKTAESCAGGKCLSNIAEKPQLAKDNGYYYIDDLFKDQPSGYYRLTFQEKSDQVQKILLKLNTYTEKENQIGEPAFSSSDQFQMQEIFFFLPEGFDSLLFQKENFTSDGNIFIKDVGITKLGITSQTELASMKKTIIGETDTRVQDSQLASDYSFPWLRESKIMLGQVFRAKDDVISAVAMKIDINKNLNPGSRQYVLSLREVKYDGKSVSSAGPVIVDTAFSLTSVEKYRQADGTFLFPLYGKLEKDKYYLISIDNSKVEVSNENYLEFRGSKDSNSYPDGSAVMKKLKELYTIDGNLYFQIYGANLVAEDGVKILNGAKIEDLGKGIGKYTYATKGKSVDLFDLETASPGTEFDDNSKIIFAPAKDNSSFGYAVNTLYPISKMNFSATQLKVGWKNVRVSYSFDQNNWIDLASSQKSEAAPGASDNLAIDPSSSTDNSNIDNSSGDNSDSDNSPGGDSSSDVSGTDSGTATQETVQAFDAKIIPSKDVRTVYFKITYNPNDASVARFFGLKDLKITADLKLK